MLLLVNNTKNAKGILTGKFFEYMASGSPILAIGPEDGELAEIISKTATGFISGFENEIQLEQNILKLFKGENIIRNEVEVNKFNRKELTKQLCEVLSALN